MNGPSQTPLPDNTQHSQETDIHNPGRIRPRNPSKRAVADPHLRTHGTQTHFLKIHFNIILPSMPRTSKRSLSLRSPHPNPASAYPVSHTCHMPCLLHSAWFYHPNNIWWGAQTPLIMENIHASLWKVVFYYSRFILKTKPGLFISIGEK
jgi:hypothetical protein